MKKIIRKTLSFNLREWELSHYQEEKENKLIKKFLFFILTIEYESVNSYVEIALKDYELPSKFKKRKENKKTETIQEMNLELPEIISESFEKISEP
jgi:hypothetical protein